MRVWVGACVCGWVRACVPVWDQYLYVHAVHVHVHVMSVYYVKARAGSYTTSKCQLNHITRRPTCLSKPGGWTYILTLEHQCMKCLEQ